MNFSKPMFTIKEITLMGTFAALTAVMAQIAIPTPFSTVPITLQTFAVFMSAVILGGKHAAVSQLVYLLLGAAGVPVFANMKGGLGVLLGPTGGYILSFPIIALVIGLILEKREGKPSRMDMIGAMVIGMVICYTLGTIQLGYVAHLTYVKAITAGVITFVPFDILKIIAAAFLGYEVRSSLIKANLLGTKSL